MEANCEEALAQARSRVWRLREGDDGGVVLAAVGQALEKFPQVVDSWGYREGEYLSCHPMRPESGWSEVTAAEAVQVRRTQQPRLIEAGLLGRADGRVLMAPFDRGFLALEIGDGDGAELEQEVGKACEILSCLLHRLDDLDELDKRERQLRQTQRLSMVGQLAAGVIHEVNNSLTVILGQSELMLLDEMPEDMRQGLQLVNRAGLNAQGLVGRMLKLAHGGGALKAPFDLNRLVEETSKLVQRQFRRDRIELRLNLEEELPSIYGVDEQVQQIVLNLIQNSRDAILSTKESGYITVKTYRSGESTILAVEDDGPGIPPALHQRVLEPFFTTKEKGKGTGLGLSVCHRIAIEHGASLRVEPAVGGARVVLEIV
jgi:signal transduction histidine kinase